MVPHQIFSIANFIALCGWLLLIGLPGRKWVTHVVSGGASRWFAVLYTVFIAVIFLAARGFYRFRRRVAFPQPLLLLRMDSLSGIRSLVAPGSA